MEQGRTQVLTFKPVVSVLFFCFPANRVGFKRQSVRRCVGKVGSAEKHPMGRKFHIWKRVAMHASRQGKEATNLTSSG